jgi:hypothetical protein
VRTQSAGWPRRIKHVPARIAPALIFQPSFFSTGGSSVIDVSRRNMDRGDPGDILGGGPIGGPFMLRRDRRLSPRLRRTPADRTTRSRFAIGTAAAAGAVLLASLILGSVASASTPTTVGYRDFGFGGALASRATSDPEQSKLWYNDGSWWGGLFVSSGTGSGGSHFNIFKFNAVTHSWADTTVRIDSRDHSHADYLWDGTHLYVVSSKSLCDTVFDGPQKCNDSLRVYRFSYNALTTTKYSLDAGFPKFLAGGAFVGPNFTGGGSNAVTIARDSVGELWLAYTRDDPTTAGPPITGFHSNVYLAHSADGVTWTTPARFASAPDGQPGEDNTAAVVAFGTSVGVYWTDKHASGASAAYFAVHNDGDPVGTWSSNEQIVTGTNAIENQVNLKADAAGKVYAVAKTGVADQIRLFDRTPGSPGTWAAHNVSTSGNGNTRAQVAIDDVNHVAYVFSSSGSTTTGTIYVKSAPLSTLSFPTGKGAAFISSASDHSIDDVTLTKQTVGTTTGIIGEASDRLSFWFLHGELALPSADATAPSGTVAINAGAAGTTAVGVNLNLTASDVGVGVNQVRVANSGGVDANGVLNGAGATNFSWTSTVPWTITAGDGTKTVYVQFEDGASNWSTPISDDILLDTTGPVGSVSINGAAGTTNDTAVSLDVTATDASVVSNVRIANAGTVTGGLLSDASAVTSAYASTKTWSLAAGPDGPRSVYVQWQDSLGNWSGVETDDIDVVDTTPPVGTVVVNGGAPGVRSLAVNLNFPSTSADVTEVDVSNSPTMAGAVTKPFAASVPWTLSGSLTNGALKTVYVVFRDGAGNTSALLPTKAYSASVTVKVDLTKPTTRGPVKAGYVAGTTMSGSFVTLRATWPAATDTGTGVGSYRVWVSKDGHSYTLAGAPTGRSLSILAANGHSYRFRVYAVDRAGNAGKSFYSATTRVAAYQETSRSVRYAGTWATSRSTLYYGGAAKATSKKGNATALTFTGRSVAWTSLLAPSRGSANVYVDGRLISTVNLYSLSTTARRIVFARTWTTSGTHTIKVIVRGTAGHPRVDLDAFFVLR